jgi:serine/threonine protein kinase
VTATDEVIADRYVVRSVLGHGGAADVYRAHDRVLDRAVAVKLLRTSNPQEEERARFAGEARLLAQLSHPSLVCVLDAGVSCARPFLVMELVEGTTLERAFASGAWPLDRVVVLGAQLADTLAYAHGLSVVHRDVKPSNILIDKEGNARLTDFGIARLLTDTVRHTGTGLTLGTAAYLSPEQVNGGDAGPPSDIYSLGLVLIESLTGTRAYDGASAVETALARLHRAPELPADLPEGLRDLLQTMTSNNPAARPSAEAVRHRLGTLSTAGHPDQAAAVLAPRDHASVPSLRPRRSWVLSLVGVTAVLVIAALAGFLWLGADGNRTEDPTIPDSVPSNLRAPLRDLHTAVEGESE